MTGQPIRAARLFAAAEKLRQAMGARMGRDDRREQRLGFRPAAMHSSLTDNERLRAWRRARNGAARILVGTRSAIFTPMPDLGLVIVDEEHDHSFKQQEGLRYSARDLAIARGKRRDIRVVLGSATPTLEMLQHCEAGSYAHLIPQLIVCK